MVNKPADTAARFRRLLAILAWLAQVQEASVEDVADRFGMSPESLVAELEMAACCGVPPYTPDQLMEIVVTDATVSARLGTSLARPRRLSPHEGFALAAAARALLAVPGSDESGALWRALGKLERALGEEPVEIDLDNPPFLAEVREATDSGIPLRVTYYSASSDQLGERTIWSLRLFAAEGHWYVDAWCREAGETRRFRVDRISAATPDPDAAGGGPAGDEPEAGAVDEGLAPGDPGFALFVPNAESRRVRLRLDAASAWLLETIPSAGQPETVAGGVEVEVFVGGTAWLERLLLRLGPGAAVVEPAEDRDAAGQAARRILRRYASGNGSGSPAAS